jgi:hypothetical protein
MNSFWAGELDVGTSIYLTTARHFPSAWLGSARLAYISTKLKSVFVICDVCLRADGKRPSTSFNRKDLNSRKTLVKCDILSMALYGAENWAFRKLDQK